MNQHVLIAQATGTPVTAPVAKKVISVVKPQGDQAVTIDLGFDQNTKLDLSAVANEKMTLVHVGTKLIILFDNQSTVTVEPFFDSTGKPLTSFDVDLGGGRDLSGEQFAATFPITDDQSVLPAAGNGSGPSSGADFHNSAVDPLGTGNPLPLLGQEDLGNFVTTNELAPQAQFDIKPSVTGAFATVILLEADLDLNKDAPGPVGDLSQGYTTGTDAAGRGETVVVKGVTFSAGSQAIDVTFGGTAGVTVTDGAGNPIKVFWVSSQGGIHLEGFLVDPASEGIHHPAIVIEIVDGTNNLGTHATHADANGSVSPIVTVTLTDQFPHSDTSHSGTADVVTITGVTLVATDGSGDTASAALPIQIADDAPIANAVTNPVTLDDDAQTLFAGNPGGSGDVPNATSVSGGAGSLFVAGADHFKSLTFTPPEGLKAIWQDTNGFAGQETLTYTTSLSGGHTILTATGDSSHNTVFTLDVAPDGSYTYIEFKPLVQSAHNVSEGLPVEETEGVTVGFTVTDGDGDHSAGSLTVNVNDDTPTAKVVTATPVLDDDAQTLFPGNPGGAGDVDNATSASGVAGALFSAGADGLKSIAFTPPSGLKAIYKDSHTGLALQETVHYTTETHATNAAIAEGHTVYTAIGDSSSHVVFTLDVAPDGSYQFNLDQPLVQSAHNVNDNGQPIEETEAVTIGFTVTDGDGDTSSGSLTVNVNDDTPTIKSGDGIPQTIVLTDNENDILTPWSQGTSPFDGTSDGSATELFTGAAIVSGSLSAIVSPGADGLKSYGFISDAAAIQYFQSLQLYSKQTALPENGLQLTYTVTHVGHDVILTANEPDTPGFGNTGNPVFSFTLDTQTGDFVFRLFDELIHVKPGTPGADSDFDLRSGPVVDGVQHFISGLDFGHIIQVTDGDGDTITLDGSVIIKIHDDAPVAHIGLRSETVTIDETPGLQKDDTSSNSVKALFASVANTIHDPDVPGTGAINFARSDNAVVVNNSTIGADAPALLQHFTLAIHDTQNSDSGLTLTDGTKISLSIDSSGRIIGVVGNDALHPEFSGMTAFAIAIDDNGYISIAQYLSLHNPTPGSSYDETVNLGGKIDAVLTITDSDGDTATDTVGVGASIKFADDGPSVDVDRAEDSHHHDVSLGTLTLDETIGTKAGDPNASSDDNGVTSVTVSPTVNSANAIGVISTPDSQHAGTSVADLFHVSINGGADGVASTTSVYSLTLTGGNGQPISSVDGVQSSSAVKTTLVVTQLADTTLAALTLDSQRTVYLFKESDGTILGRIGSSVADAADGDVALRIKLTGTGADTQLVVEQYLPIEHGNTSLADDPALLQLIGNNSSLGITLTTTVTDGDGDVASDSKTVSIADNDQSVIRIEDDGPTVTITATAANVVQDETPGVQNSPDPNAQNDVLSSDLPAGVLAKFDGVANKGVDGDVANNLKDHNALGFAVSTASLVNVTAVYGTDGHALTNAQVLSLSLNNVSGNNGADSGLKTTDGHVIRLFLENGLIVGRYDGGDGNTTVTNGSNGSSTDPAAFAIAIGQDGKVSIAQYVSLYNPTGGSSYDEPATGLKNILVSVTVTDGDGDKATASVDISSHIQFQDDGPSLIVTPATAAHGLDFGDFVLNGNAWGAGSGVATGTTNSWNIANSDSGQGGSGAVQLERVGDGYLGMHSSTGGYMVDLDASPHDVKISQVITGLANGQTYDLRFEAGAPFPDSAHLEVWFGGSLVGNISPTGQMQEYVITLTGGSGVNHDNLLEFRETGVPDNQGTYLANISVGTIVIDETPGINPGTNEVPANAQFNDVINHGSDPDMAPQFAKGTAAVVTVAANFGADGPATSGATVYSVSTTGGSPVDSGLTTTAGKPIFLFNESYNGVGYVVGRYDSNGVGGITSADDAAFAFRIDPVTGVLSVVQYVSLDHPNASSNNEGVFLNTGSLSVSVTITDGDNDTATKTADISASIRFDDDGPTASLVSTGATLIIDETYGDQSGTNDVLGDGNTPIPAAFTGLGTPIEIAQSAGAVVSYSGSYGADGPGTTAPAISLSVSSAGVWSGLSATDGQKIFLYKEGDLVIGREGTGANGGVADAGGSIAFAISIDSATGITTIAEYTAIHHNDPLDPNESATPLTIAAGALQASVTFTDGDGDHVTSTPVSIGGQIQFLDDGPSISVPTNLIVNGSFELGHDDLQADQWSIYHSILGWNSVNQDGIGNVPFELQNFGFVPPGGGDTIVELDSDFGTGNLSGGDHYNSTTHTNTIIQQVVDTQVGQTYELTFWYAPRYNEGDQNSGGMNVLWNGAVVQAINSDVMVEGQWQEFHVFVVGTGHDALGFQGTGLENSLGAYLDNVSLIPMAVVDEDGLSKALHGDAVTGNNDYQPGDAAVPDNDNVPASGGDGNEATATGLLHINWGADNYDGGTDAYSAATGFTQDGSGRSVTFTNTTVGITGGTLTSHGDQISFTLSSDGTKLIGTATHPGDASRVVIEVTLSDDDNGKFHVILKDALDHAPGGNENDIILTFNYTATDSDGDHVAGSFNVLVDDDMPVLTGRVIAPGSVNEADMFVQKTVAPLVLDFQHDTNSLPPNLAGTHLTFSGGTGIAVAGNGISNVLQGPDQNPGSTPLFLTADAGTTFTLSSIAIGTFGAIVGSHDVTIKAYDANGNLIGLPVIFTTSAVAYLGATPNDVFGGFGNAQIAKLEIDPPPGLAGRLIIDNISMVETVVTTTTTPHAVETVVDLTPLVSVGADSPGTWSLASFAQQPVTFTQGSAVGPATYGGAPITMTSDGHTITGVAGGETIFTMTLSADGHATFDLFKPIDGGTLRQIDFSQFVSVTDSDGDRLTLPSGDLLININSVDHAPHVSAPSIAVDESGLPAHNGLPAGTSLPAGSSATHDGTIAVDLGDGPSTVTINGIAVNLAAGVGQTFEGLNHFGTLVITSISATEIGYSYTLTTNSHGDTTHDDFNIVVTDNDHQTASTTLAVNIVDDAPVASNITASMGENDNTVVTLHPGTDFAYGADGAAASGALTLGTISVTGDYVPSTLAGLDIHLNGNDIVINPGTTFDPLNNGQHSAIHIQYSVTDGDGDVATKEVTVNVNGVTDNQAPTVNGETIIVDYDASREASPSWYDPHGSKFAFSIPALSLLWNDSDPDHDVLSITAVSGSGATLSADHQYVLFPTNTSGTFHYTVSDGVNSVDGVATITLVTDASAQATSGADFLIDNSLSGPNFVGGAGGDILVENSLNGGTLFGDSQANPDSLPSGSGNDLLIGSDTQADNIYGGKGDDTLWGRGGNDIMFGDLGNDTLIGGPGADKMTGGAGADHFRYNAPTDGGTNIASADHIVDFNAAEGDSIDILIAGFTGAGLTLGDATGKFSADTTDNFGANDRFHYNTQTGALMYDSNGSAAGGTTAVLAVLDNHAVVNATNIHLV